MVVDEEGGKDTLKGLDRVNGGNDGALARRLQDNDQFAGGIGARNLGAQLRRKLGYGIDTTGTNVDNDAGDMDFALRDRCGHAVSGKLDVEEGRAGATAPTGQAETQAPQPVQVEASIRGTETPPWAGGKAMARSAQASPQLRQNVACADRQASVTRTVKLQGVVLVRSKADASQASAQARQNVHSEIRRSISGKPPSPGLMMPSGQAVTQAPQRVQASVNASSPFDQEMVQGGRIGRRTVLRARRNDRR